MAGRNGVELGVEAPALTPPAGGLRGGGEMGRLIRSHDWAKTALGPVESWPQSLRTAVSIVLGSGYPMAVCWGADHVLLYNDAYRPILGGTKHPGALGRPTRDVFPEIWHLVGPMFDGVVTTGENTDYRDFLYLLDRNGYVEECYFDFSYSAVRDETGGVGGVFVTCSETTERVLGERRLATLREIGLRTAGATSRQAACAEVADALRANPMDIPFALLYLPEAEGRLARLAAAVGEADGAAWAPATVDLTSSGRWPVARVLQSSRAEVISDVAAAFGRFSSGAWPEPVREAIVLPVVPGGDAAPEGALVVGVSPRRRLDDGYRGFLEVVARQTGAAIASATAYEAAVERADVLAEIDRAKTEFFSNISHEFRTPLTLALGPLEDLLARSTVAEETARGHVEVAHRNMLRLLRLVNSLLDFSRVEAGRSAATYAKTDVGRLTRELATAFESAVEQAGMRLVVDTPSPAQPVFVDHDMWEKIVLNLVSNAFKYTLEGQITVSLSEAPGSVSLVVSDTGVGIPRGELDRIFERFHRVPAKSARTHEGAGIGLALVRDLVRLHGGEVRVESREGSGTTFTATIPTGSAHLAPDRIAGTETVDTRRRLTDAFVDEALEWIPEGEAAESPGAPRGQGEIEVLLVDDNRDMRRYLAEILAEHYTVRTAGDGREALSVISAHPPDVIVTDVMMPELDGFGLLAAVRADPATAGIPVLMLSARAGEEASVEGIRAGADDYVVKPFSARELVARVRTNAEMARARSQAADQARMYEAAASAQRRAIAVLDRIAQHLQSTTDLGGLFGEMSRTVGELVQAERAVFWSVDSERGLLSAQVDAYGFKADVLAAMRDVPCSPDGDGVVDELVYKNLLITPARLSEERFSGYQRWVQAMGVRDVIGTTWRAGDEPLGALTAYDSKRPEGFTDEDTWVLQVAALAAGLVWMFKRAERRLAELGEREAEQLRQEVERVSRLEELKSAFLRLASHELRGPIAVLRGYTEMLAAGDLGSVDPRVSHVYSILQDKLAEMSRLVDHMLDTARIDENQLVLEMKPVDLRALVVAASQLDLSLFAGQHSIEVEAAPEPVLVRGDETRLVAVFRNLVENAVKYSPDGGTVRVECRAAEDRAWVRVADRGIGIDEDDMPRLFKRFGRIVTPENSHIPGTGLGLYVSREIVRLHEGDITLESSAGVGTTVTVELPLARV